MRQGTFRSGSIGFFLRRRIIREVIQRSFFQIDVNRSALSRTLFLDITMQFGYIFFVKQSRGGSSAWLERLPVTQEVAGSSPVRPATESLSNIRLFLFLVEKMLFGFAQEVVPMESGSPVRPAKSPSATTGFVFMEQIWFVYIIQSLADESYYVGHTHDLELRVIHHNDGWTTSTKAGCPWKLVYSERYASKGEAMRREKEIKRMKSRSYIERLLHHAGGRPDPP